MNPVSGLVTLPAACLLVWIHTAEEAPLVTVSDGEARLYARWWLKLCKTAADWLGKHRVHQAQSSHRSIRSSAA